MGLVKRAWFAIKLTTAMAIAAILHFRVGVDHIYPLAQNQFAGPFTPVVSTLELVVPISISIIVTAVWLWVLYSPVQDERRRVAQGGPPR